MRLLKPLPFLIVVVALFIPNKVYSQVDSTKISVRSWIGYSQKSVRLLGKTGDTSTAIAGLGIRKYLTSRHNFDIYYTADVIPYLYFRYPKRDDANRIHTARGFAISPVGFEFERPLSSGLAFRLSTSGSFAYMDTTFPTDKGRRLNFTFDISPSFNVKVISFLSASFGYKYHHISNAQTGKENPGVDSNFFFLSLQFN